MPSKKAAPAPAETPAPAQTAAPVQNEGYCVKCKAKRVMNEPHEVTTNGRRMLKGTCPVCGTNMNRIMGKA